MPWRGRRKVLDVLVTEDALVSGVRDVKERRGEVQEGRKEGREEEGVGVGVGGESKEEGGNVEMCIVGVL